MAVTEQQLRQAIKNRLVSGQITPEQAEQAIAKYRQSGQQATSGTKQVPDRFKGLEQKRTEMQAEASNIPEIGSAPELNELSVPAFKSSFALLATGDDNRLKESFTEQFGDNVSFREDEQGNTIVDLPSGSYALNKPGLSAQDIARGIFDVAAFTPAGRAATVPSSIGRAAATSATASVQRAADGL